MFTSPLKKSGLSGHSPSSFNALDDVTHPPRRAPPSIQPQHNRAHLLQTQHRSSSLITAGPSSGQIINQPQQFGPGQHHKLLFEIRALSHTHIRTFYEGYQEGYKDDLASGYKEGHRMGLKSGFQIGEELGFYEGCINVCSSAIQLDSSCFSSAAGAQKFVSKYLNLDPEISRLMRALCRGSKIESGSL